MHVTTNQQHIAAFTPDVARYAPGFLKLPLRSRSPEMGHRGGDKLELVGSESHTCLFTTLSLVLHTVHTTMLHTASTFQNSLGLQAAFVIFFSHTLAGICSVFSFSKTREIKRVCCRLTSVCCSCIDRAGGKMGLCGCHPQQR